MQIILYTKEVKVCVFGMAETTFSPPFSVSLSPPLSEELKLASHTSQVTPLFQKTQLDLMPGLWHGQDLLPAVNS